MTGMSREELLAFNQYLTFGNLSANPGVVVAVGIERVPPLATAPTGEERDRLFGAYQADVDRTIPAVVLSRR